MGGGKKYDMKSTEKHIRNSKPSDNEIIVQMWVGFGKVKPVKVICKQILYIESDGNDAHLCIKNGKKLEYSKVNHGLKHYENELKDESYFVTT